MSKKFGNVAGALEPMAKETPSIHNTEASEEKTKPEEGRALTKKRPPKKAPEQQNIEMSQYLLKMRTDLRDDLVKLSAMNGMTIRGFIMNALKEQGLKVTDDDMIDRRKKVG